MRPSAERRRTFPTLPLSHLHEVREYRTWVAGRVAQFVEGPNVNGFPCFDGIAFHGVHDHWPSQEIGVIRKIWFALRLPSVPGAAAPSPTRLQGEKGSVEQLVR